MPKPLGKRLLVIPHEFGIGMRIRGIEYARFLSRRFDVYCQAWPDMIQASPDGRKVSLRERFGRGVAALNPRNRIETVGPRFHYVWAPVFQPALIGRAVGRTAAFEVTRRVNRIFLKRLIRFLSPDVLFLSNGLVYPVPDSSVPTYFDWYDWHDETLRSEADRARDRQYIAGIKRTVQAHVVVSKPLQAKLRERYGIEADYFPNGVDLKLFRSIPTARVGALRRELGLGARYVIGCVGNHGIGSGLEFLVDVFAEVRKTMPDSTLLVVGPTPELDGSSRLRGRPGVRWVSRVAPDDVPAYIHAMDLTVLPKRKTPMADMAFHLKGLEYTACRKVIVSNPLTSMEELRWPHVVFANETVSAWVQAIRAARKKAWQRSWDALAEDYDWERLAGRLARRMGG